MLLAVTMETAGPLQESWWALAGFAETGKSGPRPTESRQNVGDSRLPDSQGTGGEQMKRTANSQRGKIPTAAPRFLRTGGTSTGSRRALIHPEKPDKRETPQTAQTQTKPGERSFTRPAAPTTNRAYWGLKASYGTDTKTTLQQQYLGAPLRANTK